MYRVKVSKKQIIFLIFNFYVIVKKASLILEQAGVSSEHKLSTSNLAVYLLDGRTGDSGWDIHLASSEILSLTKRLTKYSIRVKTYALVAVRP